jgi:hypothetical protein
MSVSKEVRFFITYRAPWPMGTSIPGTVSPPPVGPCSAVSNPGFPRFLAPGASF